MEMGLELRREAKEVIVGLAWRRMRVNVCDDFADFKPVDCDGRGEGRSGVLRLTIAEEVLFFWKSLGAKAKTLSTNR